MLGTFLIAEYTHNGGKKSALLSQSLHSTVRSNKQPSLFDGDGGFSLDAGHSVLTPEIYQVNGDG